MKGIFIKNSHELHVCIDMYRKQYPDNYTTCEQVMRALEGRKGDPIGSVFGIGVAPNEERCYTFEVKLITPTKTTFAFVGVWKG